MNMNESWMSLEGYLLRSLQMDRGHFSGNMISGHIDLEALLFYFCTVVHDRRAAMCIY